MKSLDEAPGSERDRESKNPERGNRYETSHYKSALLSDPWKPCRRPRAIVKGSGIPEVRTMLSGIEMPHYLSLTNMFAKFLGLICTLAAGSTVFLGKVGPFVHLSTMVGSYLSKFFTPVQANKKDKAAGEMLVVAAAVGVASCFGAPVSGVLFSVEVMSSHFALTHYVPCFFAAACGALTFRLFTVWSGDEVGIKVVVFVIHFFLGLLPLVMILMASDGQLLPGAALGRLHAEGVAYVFSSGVTSGQQWASINPGGYALAGAAALSGAVTHTLSPALLAIELTGQFSHAGPVLLATLLANALARSGHRPSFYDALSVSKRLPHLPSLKRACPQLPSVAVGQFLGVKPIQLQKAAGPAEIEHAVKTSSQTQIPVVDSHESPILLGFVLRSELRIFLRHAAAEVEEAGAELRWGNRRVSEGGGGRNCLMPLKRQAVSSRAI
ncbi:hypothetical protein F2P81_012065 [Scophthalmus maximus]|uniref:Chloride channel protein n=1 Tax=Scophthalmus maximus TaxID=52904 RepID=A0A6A4SRX3_SCOMX|nr:hypothetical protein F2P81_012065 [Scophthalmus maximus]